MKYEEVEEVEKEILLRNIKECTHTHPSHSRIVELLVFRAIRFEYFEEKKKTTREYTIPS